MTQMKKTRRLAGQGRIERASEMMLGGVETENTLSTPIFNQVAWLTARYPIGEAHARVIAEHAFARRPQR